MPTLTFRNSEGALVDIPTVAATQVKNEFDAILDKVTRVGAVAITASRDAQGRASLLQGV